MPWGRGISEISEERGESQTHKPQLVRGFKAAVSAIATAISLASVAVQFRFDLFKIQINVCK